jgi:transposase
MRQGTRGRYTLEFKQEAVRLVESGQTMAAASRSLGVVEQTLGNWIKLHRAGRLKGASGKHQVTAEQMEIVSIRATTRLTVWAVSGEVSLASWRRRRLGLTRRGIGWSGWRVREGRRQGISGWGH